MNYNTSEILSYYKELKVIRSVNHDILRIVTVVFQNLTINEEIFEREMIIKGVFDTILRGAKGTGFGIILKNISENFLNINMIRIKAW
jgi:hypothetical protein